MRIDLLFMYSSPFKPKYNMSPKPTKPGRFDLDRSGVVSAEEISNLGQMIEIDLRESKANTQRIMAWYSLVSMSIFTIWLFSPFISDSRVSALADLLGLFYVAQAGVVGAYMGFTAWMSNNASSGHNYSSYYESSYNSSRPIKPIVED